MVGTKKTPLGSFRGGVFLQVGVGHPLWVPAVLGEEMEGLVRQGARAARVVTPLRGTVSAGHD